MDNTRFQEGRQYLESHGLNLLAVFDCADLPPAVREKLEAARVPLADFRRLVLIAHGGRTFWEKAQGIDFTVLDPLDDHSSARARRFMAEFAGDPDFLLLYPQRPFLLPLRQLGELAGWSHPSPLGIGIHPTFGLWFAYRVVLLSRAELPLLREAPSASPCVTCVDRPCIAACPAGAVTRVHQFDLEGCVSYRQAPQSRCAMTCRSRIACPVGSGHRYAAEQIQYHYRISLQMIQRTSRRGSS